jgi:apolipoprotein D and lipocalin family protein
MKKDLLLIGSSFALFWFFSSCATLPKGASPVDPFDINKYTGTWYEIARLDHRFERNMEQVTANYTLMANGKVKVINRGYNVKKQQWKNAEGKAKFRGKNTVGALSVSFFGPFYSPYNVIALAGDYEHALVVGKDTSYLWILSRKKSIPVKVKDEFLEKARSLGYDTSALIWVRQ